MTSKVMKTIETHNMIEANETIVIGLSGGADSVALTHLLGIFAKRVMPISLVCVHINHMLRGEAAYQDQLFVQRFCQSMGLPLIVYERDVGRYAKELRISTEEAGRQVRYQSFASAAQTYGAEKIAVAHNKNDQAETVLMRLFRGTGLKGLGGIRPVRDAVIRPLLYCGRDEIEEYCRQNKLDYHIDHTNGTDIYTRNMIRIRLLPRIQQEYNPNIIHILSQTAQTLAEEDAYLDNLAGQAMNDCLTANSEACLLNIQALQSYDLVLRRRIIRMAVLRFESGLRDISHKHIGSVLSLLDKPTGKTITLPKGLCVSRRYHELFLYKETNKNKQFSYKIQLNKTIFIKEIQKKILLTEKILKIEQNQPNCYTKIFDYDKIKDSFCLRTRKPGDAIYLNGLNGRKKVKDLLMDEKIPRDERFRFPILCAGDRPIWVAGLRACGLYEADTMTVNKLYAYIWEEIHEG